MFDERVEKSIEQGAKNREAIRAALQSAFGVDSKLNLEQVMAEHKAEFQSAIQGSLDDNDKLEKINKTAQEIAEAIKGEK